MRKKKRKVKNSDYEPKNKNKMPLIMTFKTLTKNIQQIGYSYFLKSFIISEVIVAAVLIVLSIILKLKIITAALTVLFGILFYPKVIYAKYLNKSNVDRFTNLTSYMENLIIAFKKNPKILTALYVTKEFCDGKMLECVEQAIFTIENDTSTPNIYNKALGIIEKEFKTSRLKSLHKFLITVEQGNSVNYQENIDNLYYDIHSWVTRIFDFQKELNDKKNKIIITLLASTGIVCYFTKVLVSMEDALNGASLTASLLYQIGTLVFCLIMMIMYVALESKINSVRLIEDISDDEKVLKKLKAVETYNRAKEVKDALIAAAIVSIFIAILGLIVKAKSMYMIAVLLFGGILFIGLNSNKTNTKALKNEIIKEFPAWLRDVSANLQNMVVVKAVEESTKEASPLMRVFAGRFLFNVERDPISMAPYNNFFGIFQMPELLTSIKTLYALQNISEEDAVRQINDMTARNQDLIASSEKLRLNDSIAGIGFLSAIPMLTMSLKLMGDMVVMLMSFMSAF